MINNALMNIVPLNFLAHFLIISLGRFLEVKLLGEQRFNSVDLEPEKHSKFRSLLHEIVI